MELHEIESALILAEADVAVKRAKHLEITNHRAELKKSVSEIKEKYAQEIWAIQVRMEQEMRDLKLKSNEETEEADRLHQELYKDQWNAQMDARKAEQLLQDLQMKLDVARRAQLKSAEFATLENRWDLMTMGAPWREWAKDHQISGGKKMTYEGKMILGDTMGLGKTLTSLIAIDMIEAATKDASPENPIKFGSMD